MSKEQNLDKQDKHSKPMPVTEHESLNSAFSMAPLQSGMDSATLPPLQPPRDSTIQSQATRLNDDRFSITQRQQMAGQMSGFGNQYMGQVIQAKREQESSNGKTSLPDSIQRQSEHTGSDRVIQCWDFIGLGQAYDEHYQRGQVAVDNPDYYVAEISADLLGIVGAGVSIAVSNNGAIYISYGESFGFSDAFPISGRLASGNFVYAGTDEDAAARVDAFLTGTASNICVEAGTSVCVVQAHGGETAIETGFSVNVGASAGASHQVFRINIPAVLDAIGNALRRFAGG